MRIVITGAAGSVGSKLRHHLAAAGHDLVLIDRAAKGDAAIHEADLAVWDERWVKLLAGADALLLLAGDPFPSASWASITANNLDLVMNLYEAAAQQRVARVIFASSNWVMGGRRFEEGPLTPELEPQPVNAYGMAKLVGERLGRSFSQRHGLSVICFRIGYAQREVGNQPGPQMAWGQWGQAMWLSDRDLAQAFTKALSAPAELRFAVLNLMSDNPGMRWDLSATRAAIDYQPEDGAAPVTTPELRQQEEIVAPAWASLAALRNFLMARRW